MERIVIFISQIKPNAWISLSVEKKKMDDDERKTLHSVDRLPDEEPHFLRNTSILLTYAIYQHPTSVRSTLVLHDTKLKFLSNHPDYIRS